MLIFGKGCYSASEFLERHPHLTAAQVDLTAESCNDSLLAELQLAVDTTWSTRKKHNFTACAAVAAPQAPYVALARQAIQLATKGDSTRVTITDGVHQAQAIGKDGKVVRHFTVSVPGHANKWHFYLRTNGKRMVRLSSSATEYVSITK